MMRREGERVLIDISQDEYESLLLALGYAVGGARESGRMGLFGSWLRLLNSIDKGNPAFRPYEVPPDHT